MGALRVVLFNCKRVSAFLDAIHGVSQKEQHSEQTPNENNRFPWDENQHCFTSRVADQLADLPPVRAAFQFGPATSADPRQNSRLVRPLSL